MDKLKILRSVLWGIILIMVGSIVTKWVDYKRYRPVGELSGNWSKVSLVLQQIEKNYVDTIDYEGISEKIIPLILNYF